MAPSRAHLLPITFPWRCPCSGQAAALSGNSVCSAAAEIGNSSHLPRSFFSSLFAPFQLEFHPPCPAPPLPGVLGWQEVTWPLRWHRPRCRWAKATLGTGSRERQPEPSLPRTANSLGRSKSEAAQAREARDRRGHAVSPRCPRDVPELPQPGPCDPRVPRGFRDPRDCPERSGKVRLWKTGQGWKWKHRAPPALRSFLRLLPGLWEGSAAGQGPCFPRCLQGGIAAGPFPPARPAGIFAAGIPALCCSQRASFPPRSRLRAPGAFPAAVPGHAEQPGWRGRAGGTRTGWGGTGSDDSLEEKDSTAGKQGNSAV